MTDELVARPTLRAIVLDFSAVNCIDITAAQALQDLRNQFDRYASPDKVEWHFAGVSNRWTKRALVASGFGVDSSRTPRVLQGDNYKGDDAQEVDQGPLIAVGPAGGATANDIVGVTRSGGASSTDERRTEGDGDVEKGSAGNGENISAVPTASSAGAGALAAGGTGGKKLVPVFGINRPFFHVDVATALKSAVRNTGVVVHDE